MWEQSLFEAGHHHAVELEPFRVVGGQEQRAIRSVRDPIHVGHQRRFRQEGRHSGVLGGGREVGRGRGQLFQVGLPFRRLPLWEIVQALQVPGSLEHAMEQDVHRVLDARRKLVEQ